MNSTRRFLNRKSAAVRLFSLALPTIVLVLMLAQTAMAKNTYVITDGNRVVVHTTNATDPARVLNEAGLSLSEEDTYVARSVSGVSEIRINRPHTITINNCGQIMDVKSSGETVEELLSRFRIDTTGDVSVSTGLEEATFDGMVITLTRNTDVEETYSVSIPYTTDYVTDDTIPEGTEVVLQEGVPGEAVCSGRVYYTNGTETGRSVISETVVRQPVNQIIAIGTAPETPPVPDVPVVNAFDEGGGQIILPTGEILTYTSRVDVLGTAYSCEGYVGITATGTVARVGEIAVDPDIIPLGSRLFIRTCDGEYIYGIATAEDTGGLINGYRIDLYMDTEEACWEFGARMCEVYFLG